MNWDIKEFERVANGTRLQNKMIAACRDVLVDGRSGAEASLAHGVQPPHVSRALKLLREKRNELRASHLEHTWALNALELVDILKSAAKEAAQSIKGSGWIIRDAEAGKVYEGSGVVKAGGYFVQDLGRVGVIHDLKMLDTEPVLGKRLEITYGRDGRGVTSEVPLDKGTREVSR